METTGPFESGATGEDEPAAPSGAAPRIEDDDHLFDRVLEYITPDSRLTRVELITTLLLAAAGVLTAWAALQSAKWSGEQAIHFSEAGANRIESTRFDTRANTVIQLDLETFLGWTAAIQAERRAAAEGGVAPPDPTTYDPSNPTTAGYLFSFFRPEFLPRVEQWLEAGGPATTTARNPFTPFEEYLIESVPDAVESVRLSEAADELAALARQDNQNSDDYVLTIVILATVLFFAGISTKMRLNPSQNALIVLAGGMLLWGAYRLATLPVHAIP